MRDFRFHVVTIMGIFLALGVGIFIGYSVAVSQQMYPLRNQIQAVRKHNASVEEENRTLKETKDTLESQRESLLSRERRLADLSLVGRLSGRTVALVTVGAPPPTPLVDRIWSTLSLAGARRLSEVRVKGSLVPPHPRGEQEILARIHSLGEEPVEKTIAEALANSIGSGNDPLLPAALNHRGVPIDMAGNFDQRPDLVVLLSELDMRDELKAVRKDDSPETSLVRALQAQGLRIVEVEPSSSPVSAAAYYRELGLACVDDVDTNEGKVAMVWAGLGYSGYYGEKSGADSLLPEVPRP